ncbi:MAG: type I-C CRISPR-associated protein Cas5c [Oscillospiraceae bacterium]
MVNENKVSFKVYGKNALFSDPITRMGGEKCSYPIPTYQALKGIIESVYWKPTIIWVVDRVRIMNPIQMESKGIRPITLSGGNTLSVYTYLNNVEYQVEAHFEWNENRPNLANDRNENKHFFMAKRFIEKGGRRDIFMGTRECQAYVEPCVFGEGEGYYDDKGDLTFGLMFHGFTYPDEVKAEHKGMLTARFWSPMMKNGVVNFIKPKECTIQRELYEMQMKDFSKENNNFTGLGEFSENEFGGDDI